MESIPQISRLKNAVGPCLPIEIMKSLFALVAAMLIAVSCQQDDKVVPESPQLEAVTLTFPLDGSTDIVPGFEFQ
jgi:hypothetical protein